MVRAEIDLLLAANEEAPSAARRSLDGLRWILSDEQLEHARLLVTELVTNSVLHGPRGSGEEVRLRVTIPAKTVRVEVTDAGYGFERPSFSQGFPAPRDASGKGLYLVERLSERWGVSGSESTCVWFELDCAPS